MTEGSFAEYVPKPVIDQITIRENRWGKQTYSVEDLEVIHGNTVWCLLRSGVDAPKNGYDRFLIKNAEESKNLPRTNEYARAMTLGGEQHPVEDSGNFSQKLAGVKLAQGTTHSYYHLTNQGHRPWPGITGFTVKTRDQWGMILEANIQIKVWSRDDLDLIDLVYFKPGYPALFEWGHTLYFDAQDKVCREPKLMVSNELFFKPEGGKFKDLDELVYKARQQDCNREAVFGYVTNFSWSFNHDGSFDCSLNILSKGAVIKGLRETSGLNEDEKKTKTKAEDNDWWNTSDYHRILKVIEDAPAGDAITVPGRIQGTAKTVKEEEILMPSRKSVMSRLIDLKGLLEKDTLTGLDKVKLKDMVSCPAIRVPLTKKFFSKGVRGYYITLETLCHLINCIEEPGTTSFKLKTNSLQKFGHANLTYTVSTKPNLGAGDNQPFVPSGVAANFAASLGQPEWKKSGTPTMALRPEDLPTQEESRKKAINNLTRGLSFNCTRYMPSLNPFVAIKPVQGKKYDKVDYRISNIDNFDSCIQAYVEDKYKQPNRILNIWICYNEFVSLIDESIETYGQYNLEAVIKELLGLIQKAFGDVNIFSLHCDHSIGGDYYEIVDRSLVAKEEDKKDIPILNVSGLKNTVTDLKINSEISQDLVNEMCIAATAPTEGSTGAENADECLVFWGENCKARWVTTREEIDRNGDYVDTSNRFENWKDSVDYLYAEIRKGKVDGDGAKSYDELISSMEDKRKYIQLDGEKFYKNQVQKDLANKSYLHMGIIPYKMTLTMLGISRLHVGNTFKIRNGILPRKYDNWGYLITGIEHTVKNNQWFTTLTTNYFPVFPDENFVEGEVPVPNGIDVTQNYPGKVEPDEKTIDETCSYRKAFAASGVEYELGNTHNYNGWCARFTFGWARTYVLGKKVPREGAVPLTHSTGKHAGETTMCPTVRSGDANSELYQLNLASLGYRRGTPAYMSDSEIRKLTKGSIVNGVAIGEGDVLVYYNSAGYMHTCFFDGTRWCSDTDQNAAGVYSDAAGTLTVYLFKAPPRHPDWTCGAGA